MILDIRADLNQLFKSLLTYFFDSYIYIYNLNLEALNHYLSEWSGQNNRSDQNVRCKSLLLLYSIK